MAIEQDRGLALKVAQGLHAGAIDAIKKARLASTNLVVWQDGKVVEITPDEAEAMIKIREAEKEST